MESNVNATSEIKSKIRKVQIQTFKIYYKVYFNYAIIFQLFSLTKQEEVIRIYKQWNLEM